MSARQKFAPTFILRFLALATAAVVTMIAATIAGPVTPAHADDAAAKALYDAGKFAEAVQELKSHPGESAPYFYNLGTASLKAGQLGPAVAYLTKANRLRAHDSMTQRNLQIAQSTLGRAIGTERLDPASSSLESVADRVSMGEIRGTLGLLGLLVIALWLQAYLKSRSLKRTLLQPSGLIGMIGLVITLGLYAAERLAEADPPAFVLDRVVIRSGPGSQFAQLGQLEAGVKVRQLGTQADWEQIRFSPDAIGWVPASSLLLF